MAKSEDDIQTQIYILSGVFGGIITFLLLTVTVLFVVAQNVKKRIQEEINRKEIEEEINTRRFSAYTGEEVQRQLTAATVTPTVPVQTYQKPAPIIHTPVTPMAQEYAFNTPNHSGQGVYTLQNPRK